MEKEDNFQTLNMVYKLEKIKNRKQKKYPKKMDMFDVLENPTVEIKQSILNQQSNANIIEPFDQNSSSEKTKIIEPVINLLDINNYDHLEDIKRKKYNYGTVGSKNNIKDGINYFYDRVMSFNRNIAIFIAISMSGRKPDEVYQREDESYWIKNNKKNKNKNKNKKAKEGLSFNKDKAEIDDSMLNNLDIDKAAIDDSMFNNFYIDYKKKDKQEEDANEEKDDAFAKTGKFLADATNKLLAGEVIDSPPSSNDIDIIQKYIGWGEAVLAASYMVYNWYYLIFYLERGAGHNDDNEDLRYRVTTKFLDDIYNERRPHPWITPSTASLLLFFFEFPIFFPEMLDKFLFDIVPKYSRNILNGAFCFIILFYLLTYMNIKYVYQTKNFYIDYLDGNVKNPMLGLMLGIMIFLYVLSVLKFFSPSPSKLSSMIANIRKTDPTAAAALAASEESNKIASDAKKYTAASILYFILFTILARLVVLISIDVPIAVLFLTIYIFGYSFFGIFIYQNVFDKEHGEKSFWKNCGKNIFDLIVEHITNKNGTLEYEDDPDTYMGYFNNISVLMNKFSNIFYDKIFTIGYLIVMINACLGFLNLSNIKSILPVNSIKMKELLILLIFILVIAISSYAYNSIDFNKINTEFTLSDKTAAEGANAKYKKFQEEQKKYQELKEEAKSLYIKTRKELESERAAASKKGKLFNALGVGVNANLVKERLREKAAASGTVGTGTGTGTGTVAGTGTGTGTSPDTSSP
jgi:hypothetical protein